MRSTRRAANGASRSSGCRGRSSRPFGRRRSSTAFRRSAISTPATTRASAISTSTRGAAGAGRRRAVSSSRCSAGRICGSRSGCLVEAHRFHRQARERRALAAERRICAAPDAAARSCSPPAPSARRILLMLSGVGPAAHLAEHGIPLVLDRAGVGQNLHDHLQLRTIYKVSGVKTLNSMYASLGGKLAMGLDYVLRRRGPMTMAPSQLGRLHQIRLDAGPRQHPVPCAAFVARQVRRAAASVPGLHRQRRQYAADQPRRADAEVGRSGGRRRRSGRIIWRRRRTGRWRRIRSASRGASWRSRRSRAIRRKSICPGAAVGDDEAALERAAGNIGTTIFHPVGTARMGRDDDVARRGRRAPARHRPRGPARGRRLGDAVDHLGQHQFADHDDRREGRGDDEGGWKLSATRRYDCPVTAQSPAKAGSLEGRQSRWRCRDRIFWPARETARLYVGMTERSRRSAFLAAP